MIDGSLSSARKDSNYLFIVEGKYKMQIHFYGPKIDHQVIGLEISLYSTDI